MKRKPPGPKYRNLTARGGVIYYERVREGKRVRFSTVYEGGRASGGPR